MSGLARYLYTSIPNAMAFLNLSGDSTAETPFNGPSVADVLLVKKLLVRVTSFPDEIIDYIIDYAEYWPHTSVSTNSRKSAAVAQRAADTFVLRSLPLGFVAHNDLLSDYPSEMAPSPLQPLPESGLDDDMKQVNENLLQLWKERTKARGIHPCRKIVFKLRSRDQGWSSSRGRGTYAGSYSWFDVGRERVEARSIGPDQFKSSKELDEEDSASTSTSSSSASTPGSETSEDIIIGTESVTSHEGERSFVYAVRNISPTIIKGPPNSRFDHPFLPGKYRLQSNVHASRQATEHEITWSYTDCIDHDSSEGLELDAKGRGAKTMDGEYVRSMRVGDIVTLWARARFPGWSNQVEAATLEIYWAV